MAQPQTGDESVLNEAKELLVQGKRFMALEDYQAATDCLERCCQLFDAFYGVAKRECADAYLEYGLALVALANLEAGSGTDRIMKKAGVEGEEGGEDESGEEEYDDEEGENNDEDGDKEDEQANTSGQNNENNMMDGEGDENGVNNHNANLDNGNVVPMDQQFSDIDEKKTNGIQANSKSGDENKPQPSASSSTAPEPTPGTSSSEACPGGDKDDGEDVDNEEATTIEIAWEVLCLAKRLYMTDESLEGRLKLAETLQKIGEISIEWDNNDNAVSILEECLNIRSAILPPEDRLIALTYYHLGLAHSFKSETQNANDNFQKAINVIENRIEALSKDLEKAKANQDTIAIGTYQKEINELRELLPDMTMRLDDSKEDNIKSTEILKRTREEMQQEDEEAKKVCLDKSKPVDDISHLVKRKAA